MSQPFRRYFSISSADRHWGFFVTSVGHNVVAAGDQYPVGSHPEGYHFEWKRGRVLDEFAMLLITAGRGIFEHKKSGAISLQRGDILLLPPGLLHRYRPDPLVGWEEYWVTFDGEIVRNWQKKNLFAGRWPYMARNMHSVVEARFEELLAAAQQAICSPQTLAALMQLVLFQALFHAKDAVSRPSVELKLRQAAETIRRHPAKFDIAALATSSGMPESTLRRKFLELFEVTPAGYAQAERLTQAKRWLSETPLTVREIAGRLEFSSEFYFMRFFKKQTNMTPTEWRRSPTKSSII